MDDWSSPADRHGDPHAVPRRAFVGMAALGASAALVGCGSTSAPAAAELPPDLAELLAGLEPGTVLSQWTVIAVHPIRHGAIPVVLQADDGERFQVDIMARDATIDGVAHTEHFSLFVANAGDGRSPTDERHGLGAMALAAALREREHRGAPIPQLWTMAQRTERAPEGSFRVAAG